MKDEIQDQQDKEFEEYFYPEMSNEPTMPPEFFEPVLKDEIVSAEKILAEVMGIKLQTIRKNLHGMWGLSFKEALKAMERFAEQFKKK